MPSFTATSVAASVELTSPGTITRSGRSSIEDRLDALHHARGLHGWLAEPTPSMWSGTGTPSSSRKQLGHHPVVVLAGVDQDVAPPREPPPQRSDDRAPSSRGSVGHRPRRRSSWGREGSGLGRRTAIPTFFMGCLCRTLRRDRHAAADRGLRRVPVAAQGRRRDHRGSSRKESPRCSSASARDPHGRERPAAGGRREWFQGRPARLLRLCVRLRVCRCRAASCRGGCRPTAPPHPTSLSQRRGAEDGLGAPVPTARAEPAPGVGRALGLNCAVGSPGVARLGGDGGLRVPSEAYANMCSYGVARHTAEVVGS